MAERVGRESPLIARSSSGLTEHSRLSVFVLNNTVGRVNFEPSQDCAKGMLPRDILSFLPFVPGYPR